MATGTCGAGRARLPSRRACPAPCLSSAPPQEACRAASEEGFAASATVTLPGGPGHGPRVDPLEASAPEAHRVFQRRSAYHRAHEVPCMNTVMVVGEATKKRSANQKKQTNAQLSRVFESPDGERARTGAYRAAAGRMVEAVTGHSRDERRRVMTPAIPTRALRRCDGPRRRINWGVPERNHPQGRPWPGGYDLSTRKRYCTVPLYLGTYEPDLVTNKRKRTGEDETSWQ